jgi:hypothetical protein
MAAQEGDNIIVIRDGNGGMTAGNLAQVLSEHQLQGVLVQRHSQTTKATVTNSETRNPIMVYQKTAHKMWRILTFRSPHS